MIKEMEKSWDPSENETTMYARWEQGGYFKPADPSEGRKPFTIVIPPPNITGQLHLGHALGVTLQDALIRYHRMLGEAALYLPGTDHASIATEVRIIDMLASEGITKESLGREGFLKRAWEWKEKYGRTIVTQLRRMGASCDWSRERFTLDDGLNKAVTEVFVKLYQQGLIYRGDRIINWCPTCGTALSDAEVDFEEKASFIWHIRYRGEGDTSIVVATTRPETMLGDTAVAVHPDDPRYQSLIGKTLTLPLRNRPIPVIADTYVEMDFGSGAVKITPAHDPNDFEVAKRHNLTIDRVMNDDGTMSDACGKYAGLPGLEARTLIVAELDQMGLLVKVEPYTHNVGQCYRCHHTVEPLVSRQWFVSMKPLAEPAIDAVKTQEIEIVPERFNKIYMNWMENIRDWCISRQLWWGHRIPAWYCKDCDHVIVAHTAPTVCPACASTHLVQDEDVLDTWFSSALWPFSTLGWPEQTSDLAYFYPTNVMVTAYDIIFFWVARMIFSGLKFMQEKPFSQVLLTGLIRDAQGRKMSKSLDNGIDPLEIIEKYGTDALRFSLTFGVSPGNDMRFTEDKVEAARNFANKIWNAARFVLMNLDGESDAKAQKSLADRWILHRTNQIIGEISGHLNDLDTGLATQKLYDFIWSEFCDWYLELAKAALYGDDPIAASAARHTLDIVFTATLKLLHPFMPFITEEIYDHMPNDRGSLMLSSWPVVEDFPLDSAANHDMEAIMEAIRSVRNLRAEMNVPPSRKASMLLRPAKGQESLMQGAVYFQRLAGASSVELLVGDPPANCVSAMSAGAEVFLPMSDLIDVEKERIRLGKELQNAQEECQRLSTKLANPGFTDKAPAKVVEQEQQKLVIAQNLLTTIQARLDALASL